jgi:hypothetical protein
LRVRRELKARSVHLRRKGICGGGQRRSEVHRRFRHAPQLQRACHVAQLVLLRKPHSPQEDQKTVSHLGQEHPVVVVDQPLPSQKPPSPCVCVCVCVCVYPDQDVDTGSFLAFSNDSAHSVPTARQRRAISGRRTWTTHLTQLLLLQSQLLRNRQGSRRRRIARGVRLRVGWHRRTRHCVQLCQACFAGGGGKETVPCLICLLVVAACTHHRAAVLVSVAACRP